jgi:hypothetical protein
VDGEEWARESWCWWRFGNGRSHIASYRLGLVTLGNPRYRLWCEGFFGRKLNA